MQNTDGLEAVIRRLISPSNAARQLDVSRSMIYKLMKAGKLPYVLVGADKRIPAEEVERIAREGA